MKKVEFNTSQKDVLARVEEWLHKKREHKSQLQHNIEKRELLECTFKPSIHTLNKSVDSISTIKSCRD